MKKKISSCFAAARVTKPAGELLSCSDVARELGVAPTTVRHWCREGVLRGHSEQTAGGHYRVPRRVLDALLAGELPPPPEWKRDAG